MLILGTVSSRLGGPALLLWDACSNPTRHVGLPLVVRELALPCAWPLARRILLVTPLCGPQLLLSGARTWMPPLGEPGHCQSNVRWWTTKAVSKTVFVLLKLFGEGFHVTVCPIHEGRNVTYSPTDWRYLNSCLGGPASHSPTSNSGTHSLPNALAVS